MSSLYVREDDYHPTGYGWWSRTWPALLGAGIPLLVTGGIIWGAWHIAHRPGPDYSVCKFNNSEMVLSKLTGNKGQVIGRWKQNDMCLYTIRWGRHTTEHMRPYELEKINE